MCIRDSYLHHPTHDSSIPRTAPIPRLALCRATDNFGHHGTLPTALQDRITADSSAGYLTTFAQRPYVVLFTLMHAICSTTLDPTFIVFCIAMRDLIPLNEVLGQLLTPLACAVQDMTFIVQPSGFVRNDNTLSLAQCKQLDPRAIYTAAETFLDYILCSDVVPDPNSGDRPQADLMTQHTDLSLIHL